MSRFLIFNEHKWRTRKDPFEKDVEEIEEMLEAMPELEASALFEYLQDKSSGRYADGQRRTLERKVSKWKILYGNEREIFFDQVQTPGEYMQLDWMCRNGLDVQIGGKPFKHLLCHCVLPYSNWEWATVCFSENQLSLRIGLQDALFELGGVAKILQVDNCSSATHKLGKGQAKRDFTEAFCSVVEHFGMSPRKIAVGKANQNGSVEKQHDHLRRRLKQALMLRGSRFFDSQEQYESFLSEQLRRANKNRHKKIVEEKTHLKQLPPSKLLGFDEEIHRVGRGATLRIRGRLYSLSSRLIGKQLKCHVYPERIALFEGRTKVYEMPRVYEKQQGMRWQDLIPSMVQKPGAFERYKYRAVFFPTLIFEDLCTYLVNMQGRWQGELEYLKILNHFRHLDNDSLEEKLKELLKSEKLICLDSLRRDSGQLQMAFDMEPFGVNLDDYNSFLKEVKNEQ